MLNSIKWMSQWINQSGRYRAARAAKNGVKVCYFSNFYFLLWSWKWKIPISHSPLQLTHCNAMLLETDLLWRWRWIKINVAKPDIEDIKQVEKRRSLPVVLASLNLVAQAKAFPLRIQNKPSTYKTEWGKSNSSEFWWKCQGFPESAGVGRRLTAPTLSPCPTCFPPPLLDAALMPSRQF